MKIIRPPLYPVLLAAGLVVLLLSLLAIGVIVGIVPNGYAFNTQLSYQQRLLPVSPPHEGSDDNACPHCGEQETDCPADFVPFIVDPEIRVQATPGVESGGRIRTM